MTQPNIVLILTDNQQAETLGCYGNTEVHTPTLDRLAEQGMRFNRAFCPNAFCSPCRASILTGLLPSQHGVHAWIDDRNMQAWPPGWHALAGHHTLPERLAEHGYTTGLFGKYHLGETATPGPGWHDWVTMEHGHVRSFYQNRMTDNGRHFDHSGHSVDFFCERATQFIRDADRPFFAYLPLPSPYGHWPATNSGQRNRFSHLYDDCPIDTIPRNPISQVAVDHYDRVKSQSGGGLDFSMLMRAPNHVPTYRDYYSQITLIDDAIAQVIDTCDDKGDTLFVYSADHGLSLGHHGFWGHGAATWPSNLHHAAHSVPLIVRRTGVIDAGQACERCVSNLDLFATVLESAGLEPDANAPSRSLAPLLAGSEEPGHWGADEVFAEQEETRVIRTDRWCYFRRFNGGGLPDGDALFDTEVDPQETRNLVNEPGYRDIAERLAARIDAYFDAHARPEADLWHGGRPIQNTMVGGLWRRAWGEDWSPVYRY